MWNEESGSFVSTFRWKVKGALKAILRPRLLWYLHLPWLDSKTQLLKLQLVGADASVTDCSSERVNAFFFGNGHSSISLKHWKRLWCYKAVCPILLAFAVAQRWMVYAACMWKFECLNAKRCFPALRLIAKMTAKRQGSQGPNHTCSLLTIFDVPWSMLAMQKQKLSYQSYQLSLKVWD